jgi:hypothetical protein
VSVTPLPQADKDVDQRQDTPAEYGHFEAVASWDDPLALARQNALHTVHVYPGPAGTVEVAAQLAEASAHVQAAGKDGYNEHHKYRFRSAGGVTNAVHAALATAGVALLPSYSVTGRDFVEGTNRKGDKVITERVLLEATYRFIGRDGSVIVAGPFFGRGEDTQDKAFNKAQTGAFKYALIQVFTVPTDDVDDSDSAAPQETGPRFSDEDARAAIDTIGAVADQETLRQFFVEHQQGILAERRDVYDALVKRRGELAGGATPPASPPPAQTAERPAGEAEAGHDEAVAAVAEQLGGTAETPRTRSRRQGT